MGGSPSIADALPLALLLAAAGSLIWFESTDEKSALWVVLAGLSLGCAIYLRSRANSAQSAAMLALFVSPFLLDPWSYTARKRIAFLGAVLAGAALFYVTFPAGFTPIVFETGKSVNLAGFLLLPVAASYWFTGTHRVPTRMVLPVALALQVLFARPDPGIFQTPESAAILALTLALAAQFARPFLFHGPSREKAQKGSLS